MLTNLDILRVNFHKVTFDDNDQYNLDNEFYITWVGDAEVFTVDRQYYDYEVGYVTDTDIFEGDLLECLTYVLKILGRDDTVTDSQREAYARLRS